MASHRVSLLIDGEELEPVALGWVDYSFRLAVDKVPSSGDMTLAPLTDPRVRAAFDRLASAQRISVVVDNTLVSTAKVGEIAAENPGRGSGAPKGIISLNDVLGEPFQSDVRPGYSPKDLTVLHATERVLAPWGITVEADNRANRVLVTTRMVERSVPIGSLDGDAYMSALAADAAGRGDAAGVAAITDRRLRIASGEQARRSEAYERAVVAAADAGAQVKRRASKVEQRDLVPTPGTPISKWLPEFLRSAGLLIWASARGHAILSSPDYEQAPKMIVGYVPGGSPSEGTIVNSRLKIALGTQTTEAVVGGRSGVRGASRFTAVARDDELEDAGHHVYRYVSERKARDLDAARAKAEGMLREAQLSSWTYECTVAGHGVGEAMQAPDTMVDVRDPVVGVERPLYCLGVDFNLGGGEPRVTMRLVRPGLWGAGIYTEAVEEEQS